MPEPSSSTSHCPEPASAAPTDIAYDVSHIEQSSEERMASFLAAGIKVRDFAYEPTPNVSKALEVFDPVPCLIAADWHMRNPHKNFGLLSPKGLFRLIKMSWPSLADVRLNTRASTSRSHSTTTAPTRGATRLSSCPRISRYRPPSQRVKLRRQAGLCSHPDDVPDSEFFGYNPTGLSDDEGEGGAPPHHSLAPPTPAETASGSGSGSGSVEAEVEAVEGPKSKRRKVKGAAKTRGHAKPKALRRECSRPEV
jgi:hypothetical protein